MRASTDESPNATSASQEHIRVAHLADLHFGFSQLSKRTPDSSRNQREADVERAALVIADYLADDVKPDIVVVSGDLQDATRISTPGLMGERHFCRRLKDLPLIVIGGNHDHVESPIPSMLEVLRKDGADIYLEPATVDIAGARLHLMPFRALARLNRADAEPYEFDFSETLTNILVAHASTEGYSFRDEPVEIPARWVEDERFAACLLGHIHEPRQIKGTNAFYAGAVERLDFGERGMNPGFYLHTFSGRKLTSSEFITVESLAKKAGIELTPRPMRQIVVEAEGKTLEEIDAEVRSELDSPDIRGSIIKLLVHNVSAAFAKSHLKPDWQKVFQAGGGLDLDISAPTRLVGELLDVEFAAPPIHLAEAFTAFLREQEFSTDAERDELIELGTQALDHARDRLAELEGSG